MYTKGSGQHTKVDSGWNVNGGNGQQLRNNFIQNRMKARMPMKQPMRGIGQDPIQRQMNQGLQSALQKYKMNGNGYDSQIDAQQRLQDAGGESIADKLKTAIGNPNIISLDPREWNGGLNTAPKSMNGLHADGKGSGNYNKPVNGDDGFFNIGVDPYDGNRQVDRSSAGANQFINGKTSLGETLADMTDMFKGSGDSIQEVLARYRANAPQIKGKKMPSRSNRRKETPENALSETLMRYLQGMFNGGF
jgi:hypothetical protein